MHDSNRHPRASLDQNAYGYDVTPCVKLWSKSQTRHGGTRQRRSNYQLHMGHCAENIVNTAGYFPPRMGLARRHGHAENTVNAAEYF